MSITTPSPAFRQCSDLPQCPHPPVSAERNLPSLPMSGDTPPPDPGAGDNTQWPRRYRPARGSCTAERFLQACGPANNFSGRVQREREFSTRTVPSSSHCNGTSRSRISISIYSSVAYFRRYLVHPPTAPRDWENLHEAPVPDDTELSDYGVLSHFMLKKLLFRDGRHVSFNVFNCIVNVT